MFAHHRETLDRVTARFADDSAVRGVLLVGSIAHGFEIPQSDVDIMLVLSEPDFAARERDGTLAFLDLESANYDGGYVDIKCTSIAQMQRVRESGSEPARFAFEGAVPLISRDDGLADLIAEIARYPLENKLENIARFHAQLQAWKWYSGEALKHDNTYLLSHSINNLILFGGRMILAENATLYPYHKWFLRVLSGVADLPDGLMELIDTLLRDRQPADIERFFEAITAYRTWPEDLNWPNRFMIDSEMTWMTGHTPVADL
jgi:hypothetical protein